MIISIKNLLRVIAVVTLSLVLLSKQYLQHMSYASIEVDNSIATVSNLKSSNIPPSIVHPGLPWRLNIPRISVDTHLEEVGLTDDGALDVPKDPANAAWYKLGPRPGENGNSIIDGHFGWSDGVPAVFDRLNELRKGDKISVTDKKGRAIVFVASEIRDYGEYDDNKSVFISKDGKPRLVLISCEGEWSVSKQSYSKRLVVFADLE